ncbi:hypothetical protein MA13_gp17 [Pectobacterium phage MA13]|uniref:Uncharacterized protein n=1 Tax=Pectobacterium phage MA13 TaxID=2662284 RepID=A0A5Q2F5I7_9CAUD|nr:hypothetical protein MA13_gp17 [Pectobacterium phage MA13]
MRNVIDVNPYIRTFLASELGDQIARGLFKQVGVIRTEYVQQDGTTTRSMEAVIHDLHLDKLYAVEQYRGLAIRAEVVDEEMLAQMREVLPTLAEGEGFTYDQRIVQDVVDVAPVDESRILAQPLTGEEGLNG